MIIRKSHKNDKRDVQMDLTNNKTQDDNHLMVTKQFFRNFRPSKGFYDNKCASPAISKEGRRSMPRRKMDAPTYKPQNVVSWLSSCAVKSIGNYKFINKASNSPKCETKGRL